MWKQVLIEAAMIANHDIRKPQWLGGATFFYRNENELELHYDIKTSQGAHAAATKTYGETRTWDEILSVLQEVVRDAMVKAIVKYPKALTDVITNALIT